MGNKYLWWFCESFTFIGLYMSVFTFFNISTSKHSWHKCKVISDWYIHIKYAYNEQMSYVRWIFHILPFFNVSYIIFLIK